jgi:hypothetical protein
VEVVSHLSGYYLLGIEPPHDTFDRNKDGSARFRAIAVSVSRPGLRVRTRSGFLGIADSEFDAGRRGQQLFAAALDSPFQQTGVKTDVRCAFINVEKSRSVILTRVGIAASDLSLAGPANNRSAIIHLMVRAYGVDGAELEGGIDQRLRINLDEQGTRVSLANGLIYSTNVTVGKPGPYQVRAAVLDEASGRLGTGLEFLVVPKTRGRQMLLSDLTFPSYFGRENHVAPAWERLEVSPGQIVRCAFQVFNADSRDLTERARLFRDGKLVFEGPSAPLPRERGKGSQALANAQVTLPRDLEPGEYYLQIEVSDGTGKALRWAKLTVAPPAAGRGLSGCAATPLSRRV